MMQGRGWLRVKQMSEVMIATVCVSVLTIAGGIICYSGGAIECAYPSDFAAQYHAPACVAPGSAESNSPTTHEKLPAEGSFDTKQTLGEGPSPEPAGPTGLK